MSDGERAESRTHPFWGTSWVSCLNVHVSALPGAVPLVGGNFVFLGTKVPWGVSSEGGGAAHGPLHTAMYKSLETFMALLAGFFVLVLVLFFACLSWVIRLSGWFLFGHSALQDSTRVGILFGSLSLFLFGVFAGDVFFFVSRSQRRWGNPNPFGVWISPCDSSSCARTSTSTRSSSSAHTSRSSSRTCFLLSRRRSRGLWSVFRSRGGVSVRSVFWLVLVACLLSSCALASCLVFRETATPGFRPQWRLAPFPLQIGSSWVTRLLLAGSRPWDGPICGG